MTEKQAIRLAIKTMESEILQIAFLANLYDMVHTPPPSIPAAKTASKKRKDLKAAIEILKGML